MTHNAPIKRLAHGEFTVEGYSRAAVQTYWRIPEFKIGFDLGAQPWDFMGTATWFVTHTHLDHIAALPVYVARRRMMKMDPPTIYVPEHALVKIQQFLQTVEQLDRGRLPCQLVPVAPGDELEISRELVVTVHPTTHTVPSVGYIVWQRRHKLKSEYHDFSGEEIRDLRLNGIEVSEEIRVPQVAYLGDSRPRGLDDNPDMYRARVLIAEMTFVAPSHRKDLIHKHGHIHLDDVVARRDRFENERVIFAHFSTRYHDRQIRSLVEKALPGLLDGRICLWL